MNIDLHDECARFLALRESLGLRIDQLQPLLEKFVRHLSFGSPDRGQSLTVEAVLSWVCEKDYSASTQHVRLSAARIFLRHMKILVPEIEIPSVNLIARRQRREPFVFSRPQLIELMDAAGTPGRTKKIPPETLKTLVGLMACSGIRPGEARQLKLTEVFLDESPPRLLVYQSKFGKTRWVPLHPTTVDALRQYLGVRNKVDSSQVNDLFFITTDGRAINRITLHNVFQRLIAQTSIRATGHQLRPSLNSLRHTFAVHRLNCWYEAGEDVRSLLPNLSVYLGHSDPVTSYWYLTCTPDLMVSASQRFQLHSASGKEVNNVEEHE